MKPLLLAALLFALPVFAQPVVSPEVMPDGRVTFRLAAPNAKAVRLNCESAGDSLMQKADHGVWTFTTAPLEPDIYTYSFSVDGLRLTDPANPFLKYNLLNSESQVLVPGAQPMPWEITDVPHGELHRHFYKSAAAGDDRDYIVYTPPGYQPSAWKRYPVLYLLHGYSDDTTGWTAAGRANVILDNLIASGAAKPMLVVMPLGYGTMDILKAGWSRVREPGLWERNVDKFTAALLDEVMPQVAGEYRVSKDRQDHAIAGLSMGGTESLVVGLNHLDRFAWIGAFSSGGLSTNFVTQFPNLNSAATAKLRLLWIGCGKDDKLVESNLQLCDWLKTQNVPFTWKESPGVHSFRVWRRNLAEFAPMLFRNSAGK